MNCRKDSLTPFSLNYTPNLLKTYPKKKKGNVNQILASIVDGFL